MAIILRIEDPKLTEMTRCHGDDLRSDHQLGSHQVTIDQAARMCSNSFRHCLGRQSSVELSEQKWVRFKNYVEEPGYPKLIL